MPEKQLRLSARVSSENPSAIRAPLERFVGSQGTLTPTDDGFYVETVLEGDSARDLNRQLLTELRRAEKRTRLRAEWTFGGTTEKFFDYVPKGTRKSGSPSPPRKRPLKA